MAWTDNTFPFGSLLTSSKMTALQANFQAFADKDSGAPTLATAYVVQAMLGSSSVSNAKLQTNSVSEIKLQSSSVSTAKLQTSSVSTAKLKTSTGNVNGTTGSGGTTVGIAMQDYCFYPNFYAASSTVQHISYSGNDGTTVARMGLLQEASDSNNAYDIDYRYVTASDKPFLYFIRDKQTGEILHTWWSDDPPPGYWHLSSEEKAGIESGESFNYPIRIDDWGDPTHEAFTKFDYPEGMEAFREWTAKGKSDGHGFAKHMSDNFDFDTETKLFKPKNLQEI